MNLPYNPNLNTILVQVHKVYMEKTQRTRRITLYIPRLYILQHIASDKPDIYWITWNKRHGGGADRVEYARYGNPTIRDVEDKLALLDHGADAILFPSGMNAITTLLLTVLRAGQHLVMTDDC
jgi:cystathionine beta-lyase/cystathionine gamma-synthase